MLPNHLPVSKIATDLVHALRTLLKRHDKELLFLMRDLKEMWAKIEEEAKHAK